MSANVNTRIIDNPLNGKEIPIWHRLHAEREDICETLLKESCSTSTVQMSGEAGKEDDTGFGWHKELLQARLRKVDDALDRLMSGSYGNCCKCGRWIEDTKLAFDPAVAFCVECWTQQQEAARAILATHVERDFPTSVVTLETLRPFDTILAKTRNSEYRLVMLEPFTGRALVENGRQFIEPVEVVITGCTIGGSSFQPGRIQVGFRMEMQIDAKLLITSPVQSVSVEHHQIKPPSAVC